jgi:hypothetical protein
VLRGQPADLDGKVTEKAIVSVKGGENVRVPMIRDLSPVRLSTKELLAVVDGYQESTQSWRELVQQLKRLGLSAAPEACHR